MDKCVTCGRELHPERAKKYNYCMSPECQEKNAKGLTMVAVGVNKAAEQYMILDEHTKEELASGKYHDQRRGSFGTSTASSQTPATSPPATSRAATSPAATSPAATSPAATSRAATPRAAKAPAPTAAPEPHPAAARAVPRQRPAAATPRVTRPPWSQRQQRLALLYNEQGLRPDEIAEKLGISRYLATQIILSSRTRGKL